MRKTFRYIVISLFTVLLIGTVFFCYRQEEDDRSLYYVSLETNNKEIKIKDHYIYVDEIDYFFLPGNYQNMNAKLHMAKSVYLKKDDVVYKGTIDIGEIEFDEIYSVYKNDIKNYNLVFKHGSNIGSMFIDTKNDIDYLKETKEHSSSGTICVLNKEGTIDYKGELESISGRGNDSWTFDKKGWSITLKDKTNLLDMKKSDRWILVANCRDDSFGLRNKIAYSMAKAVGLDTTSDLEFCDLYINGDYQGLYTLIERIQQGEEFLDIGDLEDANNRANHAQLNVNKISQNKETDEEDNLLMSYSNIASPEDISGGYILERNFGYKLEGKNNVFCTSRGEYFIIRYPSVVSKEETEYIKGYMQSIENALFADDYIDPVSGKELDQLIDLDSWVLKYLVDETLENEGAGATSSYYYKKNGDDLIYGGPVWDFDKSVGNCINFEDPEQLTYSAKHDEGTLWFLRLYNYDKANTLIKEYYKERVRNYLSELKDWRVEKWSYELEDSYYMNFSRWKKLYTDNKEHEEHVSSRHNTTNSIKTWLKKRNKYLDKMWLDD